MMTAELKAKWTAALRSGEYRQGKEYLSYGGCMCCLGVLCAIENVPSAEQHNGTIAYRGADGIPSDEDLKQWGLDVHTANALADMNDEGRTFAEIADFIDQSDAV